MGTGEERERDQEQLLIVNPPMKKNESLKVGSLTLLLRETLVVHTFNFYHV